MINLKKPVEARAVERLSVKERKITDDHAEIVIASMTSEEGSVTYALYKMAVRNGLSDRLSVAESPKGLSGLFAVKQKAVMTKDGFDQVRSADSTAEVEKVLIGLGLIDDTIGPYVG